ncbi:MAG: peptidyl-prolyl cis-trans isomerase [Chthoniobacterales bacterium]
MINILRKNQKGLWIVIGLLCIPFVFYFSKSDIAKIQKDDFGHFYGHTVTRIEFQRGLRLFNLARDLGMYSFLQGMIAGAQSENAAQTDFVWNHLILHHEAERLGLAPSASEIAPTVKKFMAFQGDKGFDINKYNQFTQNVLPSMGFGEAQIEELASDQLILEKLKTLVSAGATVPEAELKENYERAYGKLSAAVVRVKSEEIEKGVQISDEEIAKYYETHKAELMSEEKRKVEFVSFSLDDEQKKLTGKDRVPALQKLADRANDFNQALLEKGAQFEQVAAKFQLPIETTEMFAKSQPDPKLSAKAQLVEPAFQLKPDEPNSDAIQVGDGFYVLHLMGTEPPRPLAPDEAKPKIAEKLKKQRVTEMVATKGAEAARSLREAMKAGTPLDAALQATGLPMEKIPPFALAEPPMPKAAEPGKPPTPDAPDLQTIKTTASELKAGEVSNFLPTPTGGAVVVLEKREQPDPANYEKTRAEFTTRMSGGKKEIAFYEWLRERRREAGVQTPVEPSEAPVEQG